MNCPLWEEKIALYAGGDLSASDAAPLAQHLAECVECSAFAADLSSSLDLLRSAHTESIADGHFTAVRARVLEKLARETRPWWRQRPAFVAVAAAVLIVLLVVARPRSQITPHSQARIQNTPVKATVVQPDLPTVARVRRPRRLTASSGRPTEPAPPVDPLVVKLVTDDPDVVIYWIADK